MALLAVPQAFALPAAAGAATLARRQFSVQARSQPLVGAKAPEFEADAYMPSGEIAKVSLRGLLEKYDGVCLLFYPLDFSFVCPTELLAFNQKAGEFKQKNWALVAVSVDSVHSHGAWSRLPPSEGGVGPLSFPLLSDLSKEISRSYCLLQKETISLRGCVLVDKDGLVKHMTVNDLSMGRNVEETLRVIDMVNHIRKNGAQVCPANWAKGKPGMSPTLQGVKDYASKQQH